MKTARALLAISLPALWAGCALDPSSAAPSSGLEGAFQDAAAEYQVPVSVLKAIAYVETRVDPKVGRSAFGGHGLMQLIEREDWNTLQRASALTGVDAAHLERDPAANIRGAAAVLRELADRSFAQYPELDPQEPGDFFHAVSLYSGLSSAAQGTDYASDVYATVENGFQLELADGPLSLSPSLNRWRERAPASVRQDALKEYPGAYRWVGSPNYTNGRSSYTYVLIHTTQGSYSGAVSWLANPASHVSAHYVVRSSDGQITQMVENSDTAWHAQCYNSKSIGIEHEGFVSDPARWYTDALYTQSAKLTRWLCDRYGIPRNRTHIIGHVEVAPACNTSRHSDPGSGWNWTKYMALVNGSTPTATTGKLTGAIYTGGSSSNRVQGAVVTVNGRSVTTAADGLYEFVLPPGSYTASVTKAGFSSTSVVRTVTASATIWGSMEINPSAATGTLKGKVFVFNSANPSDNSQAVGGATVSAGGKTATTDPGGLYSFTLAPGTYTISASKSGFAGNSLSRAVVAGGTVWGSMGLSPTQSADAQAPSLAITFPGDGAKLDLAVLTLTGTASDDRGALTSVTLRVNGGAPATVPVSGGAFSQQIKLAPGTNTLELSATDAAGNAGQVTSTATFNAGVAGFVHLADDAAARVPGVTVELLQVGTGESVTSAVSGPDGAFSLEVTQVPADYVLVARGAGFLTRSETVSVPDDERLKLDLPMLEGTDPEVSDVGVSFAEPQDGATVSSSAVVVRGSVFGMQVVAVTVNGEPAEVGAQGKFVGLASLTPGANTIEAVARGTNQEVVSAKITIHRRSSSEPLGEVEGVPGCGCTSAPGAQLLALLLAAPLLRRRRGVKAQA